MARVAKDSIDNFLNHNIDLSSKTIYLGAGSSECDVDENLAANIIKGLHILDRTRTDEPITVIINNRGGDITHGLAIFDALRSCKSEVIGKVVGSAESMGAWLLQACDVRYLSPNSLLMFHMGEVTLSGHLENVKRQVRQLEKSEKKFEDILLARIRTVKPSYSRRALREKIVFDWELTAEEAIEWGLADGCG